MATGTLTGQTIANTYKSLLKITGTTGGGETLHATTQKVIEDGDGNPFPLSAAQDALMITSTNRLEFGTNANYVYQVGSNVLGLVAGSEIDLTATAIDINGTADISGAVGLASSSGVTTIGSSNGLTVSAAGVLTVNSATDSTSKTTGSTIIDGGVGIAKTLHVGTGIVEEGGVLKENLLFNSGFDVWSNSTLENVGSALLTSWAESGSTIEGTLTTSGADITEAVNTSGYGTIGSNAIAFVAGKLYRIVLTNYAETSGVGWQIYTGNAVGTGNGGLGLTGQLADGSFVFEAVANDVGGFITLETLSSAAASLDRATFSCFEVTPGCVASSGLACDGWEKGTSHSAFDIWRQHNDGGTNTHDGSFYSLKMNYDRASQPLYGYLHQGGGTDEFTQKFAGKTVTFGCWVKSSVTGKAGIGFDDTANTFAGEGDELLTSGSDTWEWLELTKTFGASISGAWFYLRVLGHAGSVSGTHVGYYSQPIVVFGSSIGEGNYTRPRDEIIWGEDRHHLTNYSGESFSDIASPLEINLEAASNGKIPKGVKAVYVVLWARDSDTATGDPFVKLWGFDRDMPMLGVDMDFADAAGRDDVYFYSYGWVPTADNGDFAITVAASGSNTTDLYISIMGYQLA